MVQRRVEDDRRLALRPAVVRGHGRRTGRPARRIPTPRRPRASSPGSGTPIPRFVFSTTLEEVQWNSRLVRGDVGEVLARIREEFDGDLEVGGPTLAAEFIRRGLVDEYRLVVHPVVLGAGTPFFPPLDEPLRLRLVDTRRFASGARVPGLRPRLRVHRGYHRPTMPDDPDERAIRRRRPDRRRRSRHARRGADDDADDAGERRHDLTNGDLARIFHEIGDMLEVKGEIAFKTDRLPPRRRRDRPQPGRPRRGLPGRQAAEDPGRRPGDQRQDRASSSTTGRMALLRAPPRGGPAEPRRAARGSRASGPRPSASSTRSSASRRSRTSARPPRRARSAASRASRRRPSSRSSTGSRRSRAGRRGGCCCRQAEELIDDAHRRPRRGAGRPLDRAGRLVPAAAGDDRRPRPARGDRRPGGAHGAVREPRRRRRGRSGGAATSRRSGCSAGRRST